MLDRPDTDVSRVEAFKLSSIGICRTTYVKLDVLGQIMS